VKGSANDLCLRTSAWDERLRGGRNSFDLVRLALATMVVFEHSFFLIDNSVERDPLNIFTDGQTNFGTLAVWMFFSISGFLVTMSAVRSRSILAYLARRIARIGPGFLVASIVGSLIVGPLAAKNIGAYITGQNWITLIVQSLTLHQANPSATLEANPLQLVHGTLWSIKYEFDCYLMIAALALLLSPRSIAYLYAGLFATLVLLIICAARLPVIDHGVPALLMSSPHQWPKLFPFFLIGSAFYVFRDRIKKSSAAAIGCAVAIAISFRAGGAWWILLACGTYLCVFSARSIAAPVQIFGARVDLSYGVYLYGWPVQQSVLHCLGTGIGPWALFAISMLLTLPVAYLSWRLIEKPALRLAGSKRD
jgi:peptidoglycan/LPS O-acetylase OafA/YrhL